MGLCQVGCKTGTIVMEVKKLLLHLAFGVKSPNPGGDDIDASDVGDSFF